MGLNTAVLDHCALRLRSDASGRDFNCWPAPDAGLVAGGELPTVVQCAKKYRVDLDVAEKAPCSVL